MYKVSMKSKISKDLIATFEHKNIFDKCSNILTKYAIEHDCHLEIEVSDYEWICSNCGEDNYTKSDIAICTGCHMNKG